MQQAAASADIVASRPAGTVDGDLLIAQINTANTQTITAVPSGWLLIGTATAAAQTRTHYYWKIAASEPATWTWTRSAAVNRMGAQVHRVTGHHATAPIAAFSLAGDAASGSTITAPGITTPSNDCLLLLLAGVHTVTATKTGATAMTERVDAIVYQGSGVDDIGNYAATQDMLTAGATGDKTVTLDAAGRWAVALLAIRDASAVVGLGALVHGGLIPTPYAGLVRA